MKILITGLAVFIGSNLAQSLITQRQRHDIFEDEIEIIGIDDLSYGVRE